jgi:hypothetical protein
MQRLDEGGRALVGGGTEGTSVGTRISPRRSIDVQSASVAVTVNSFGPHIVS